MLEEADAIVEEPVVNNEDLLEAIWGQSFVDNQAIIDSICETPPAPVDATPPAPVEAPVEETATPAALAAPATRVDADAAKKCRSDIRKSKLTVLKLCAQLRKVESTELPKDLKDLVPNCSVVHITKICKRCSKR
ncbi:hypothetical protein IF1G_10789 [Cordyceps javanica]|uniref:Uncharacterized protein n=1 Tax=Cordyceps javanica TaxID=43265 RepID=A0A545UMF6_9HYPO|nr:hypothetical protein IF1G_10789 [Cordyceps javanica]TQW02084.1 hypothetical protein IF2G_10484 [Cordyceps javanica]